MPTLVLALALALTPARSIDTPAQAAALCEALVPPGRWQGKGDVVRRGQQEAEHARGREAALDGTYRVLVPGARLRFAPYDPEEQRLALAGDAYLAGGGGALRVWALDDGDLPVTVGPDEAERIVAAAARRTLALSVTFALPEDDEDVACAGPVGARRWSLGVEPVAWEYVEEGRVLARGGEGADRPTVTAAEGARPVVQVSAPAGPDAAVVRAVVERRAGELERCYLGALARDPALDGSLVAELDLAGSGPPTRVAVALDAVQDPALASCVRDVLAATRFPDRPRGRMEVPIAFALEPPAPAR